MFEQPQVHERAHKDFLAFLQSMEILFVQKKQVASEVINAFVKRLALI